MASGHHLNLYGRSYSTPSHRRIFMTVGLFFEIVLNVFRRPYRLLARERGTA
jgi:hypothetical protein